MSDDTTPVRMDTADNPVTEVNSMIFDYSKATYQALVQTRSKRDSQKIRTELVRDHLIDLHTHAANDETATNFDADFENKKTLRSFFQKLFRLH